MQKCQWLFWRPNTTRFGKWGLYVVEMLISLRPKHWLTLSRLGNLKIVLRSGTSHTRKQGGLKTVCGTTNITRLGYNPSPFWVGWIHNIGTLDGSLTTIISRGSGTQSQLFTFNNVVVYLPFMWPDLFPTKSSHLSMLFHTCASSPKFQ
jgi:hypothetical protein